MPIELTEEAIHLIYLMTVEPAKAWKKEQWHPASKENADRVSCREVTQLGRWVSEKAMSPFIPMEDAKERGLTLVEQLKLLYGSDSETVKYSGVEIPRAQFRNMVWSGVQQVFSRPGKPGTYRLKERMIERLQDLVKHYRGKPTEGNICLTMNFADLEEALDGKKPVTAEDAEEPEAKAEASPPTQ